MDNITDNDWKLIKEKYKDNLEEAIDKLKANYPVQYLIGDVIFYDSKILVNENVLIPRFETELLVDKVIKKIKKYNINNPKILDIGTGSGCIIINIAKFIKCRAYGIDISNDALKLASLNAKLNNVNVKFKQMDILTNELDDEYDIIVSNPPYVSFSEEVDIKTKFEPQNAIFANNNGLQFYYRIIDIADKNIKLIAFEIGMNQAEDIKKYAMKKFLNHKITIGEDLCNRNRYLFIEKENNFSLDSKD